MPNSSKLKIGLVLDTSLDPADGVQQYVINIGEWLRKQGLDVHYLVGETDKRDLPNIHSLARNIGVRFNGNRTTVPLPASRKKLKSFLDHQNFDVLHVQMPHSPFLAQRLIMAAADNVAVIGTFHIASYGWMTTAGNNLLGYWLKPSLKRFDQIVSVSSAAEDFARRTFGIETEVLPNVVDYDLYHDAEPFDGYDDSVLTILFLGRLVERKGCQVLLEAVAELARKKGIPEFRLLICGKGHLENQLRGFVAENHLEKIVTFKGFVSEEDKPRYYASADLSVFPSSGGESFGIVLIEAMASGQAAVLAGDNPGYNSVMSDKPDLLFAPKNAKKLAEKLETFLTDNELRKEMAAWGETYTKSFDVDTVGNKLQRIYKQALLKRSNR